MKNKRKFEDEAADLATQYKVHRKCAGHRPINTAALPITMIATTTGPIITAERKKKLTHVYT